MSIRTHARRMTDTQPVGPLTPGPADVPAIERLLASCAPGCIPLDASTIRRHLHRFAVFRFQDRIVATASVRPIDLTRLELRSLAVDEAWSGQGLGKRLVQWAVAQARQLRKDLVCVSRERGFFEMLDFYRIPDEEIPPKATPVAASSGERVAMQYDAAPPFLRGGDEWKIEPYHRPRAGVSSMREMFCRCPV